MSSTVTFTTTCDAPEGCSASCVHKISEGMPEGWVHVPGRDSKRFYSGTRSKDYCPTHAPERVR